MSRLTAKVTAKAKAKAKATATATPRAKPRSTAKPKPPARRKTSSKLRWMRPLAREVTAPAIATDGSVVVGLSDGRLCALSPADGSARWAWRAPGAIVAPPAIAPDGTIYAGTVKGKLVVMPGDGNARRRVLIPIKGAIAAPPAIDPTGTTVVVMGSGGTLTAVRAGKIAWRRPTTAVTHYLTEAPVIGADGTIYAVGGDRRLHAVGADGAPRWSLTGPTFQRCVTAPVCDPDGRVYVVTEPNRVLALRPDGGIEWQRDLGFDVGDTLAYAGGLLYVPSCAADARVHVLGRGGEPAHHLPASNWIRAAPAIDRRGTAYFGSLGHVYAYDAGGKQRWRAPVEGDVRASPVIADDGTVYVATDRGHLYAFAP